MKRIISIILTLVILTSCSSVAFAAGAYDENGKYVYRNNTFQFQLIDEDPQHITDEEFFGVWNKEMGEWDVESCFDYEKFPGLADVEAAVKAGDYVTAKQELKDYYLPQQLDKVPDQASADTDELLMTQLQGRNMYTGLANAKALAIFPEYTSPEWKTISVSSNSLTSYVSGMVKKSAPFTAVIASMDKSNTAAEIMSRHTENPPTLSLVVNNVQKVFVASEDTYISPGLNTYNNYGREEYLYAQEYGYVGHWDDFTNPWTETCSDTKRTYIKFDLSSINPNDKVTSATLSITVRTAPGGDLEEKELLLEGWNDSSWEEYSANWKTWGDWLMFSCNDLETWNFIASNDSNYKGKLCFYHRGSYIQGGGEWFHNTGNEEYAYTFLRQMMSTIYNVGVNDDVMCALDMSNHIYTVGRAFIYCWDSEYMSPEIFTAAMKHFYLMTEFMIEKWLEPEVHWNNWATNQTRSSYWSAMVYPEFKRADYWYDCTLRHNDRLFRHGVYSDGSSIEQALGYVDTWLSTVSMAHTVYTGVDNPPYGVYCDDYGVELLRQVVVNTYYSTAPGMRGFGLGDGADTATSFKDLFQRWYKILVKLGVDDPHLEYISTNGARGSLPDFTSISFPEGLRTFMRSDWGSKAIALAFTNKGDNASHAHRDQLHVVLKAYGQDLIVDPSYNSDYTTDLYQEFIAAEQHNTLTVNGKQILNKVKDQDGTEKEQELNNLYNFTTYATQWVDDATNAERSVMFLKNQKFFIVSDYVELEDNSKVNTVKQFWHMLPSANIDISQDGKSELRSHFDLTANVIVTPVDTESMSGIYLEPSIYAGRASLINNNRGVYERKARDTVKYGTILYPLAVGEDRNINTDTIDVGIENNGASAFRIRIEDSKSGSIETYYYYHLSDLTQKKPVTIGNYTTDATTLLVQEDISGKAISFFVYDGSYVEKYDIKDKYLFKSTSGPVTLGVNLAAGTTAEFSTNSFEDETLKNITVYTGHNVTTAVFNGKVCSSNKSGAYMYFSHAPIIECTEENVNTGSGGITNDTIFGDFGGSGGGGGGGGGIGSGNVGAITPEQPPAEDNKEEEITPPVVVTPSYNDVTESDWYYDYVLTLSEKQIISGDGTGNFAPNHNITREQFLKMLLVAVNAETEEAENTFTDVEDNAWYKEYVLKAKSLGIVNGISDKEFGIGTNITRQDMAVMIGRIIEKMKLEVEEGKADKFADDAKVSAYAKESVMLMKSIGLIEGYNNQFRPTDTLTRAESAKVISELLKLIEVKE
ncbi:MAG: S-layer homology domain-containing protein [Clostridia bacterium]|nr:S-layer homology domain-containing protein [Clostridia bacterium]